ncbi:hypothetical protein [uncultured Pontibacter sp.]|uniref:hypothetical protein n=1 Tax=uncultured Pontibacter sp. TaxID=453356 RepID=UPI002639537A|nr:hypothetical protein [uncultured Pontibacter sp.]
MIDNAKSRFSIVSSTAWFSLAGLFIPGFTAVGILGLQQLIVLSGVECASAWDVLWHITGAGCFLLPWLFFLYILKTHIDNNALKTWLLLFNVTEYALLQALLASFFTNGQTLCYVVDGQNGLEFAFTGWFAIPILFVISLVFQRVSKFYIEENEDQ